MNATERYRAALRQHLNDIDPDDPHYQPIRRIVTDRLAELDQTKPNTDESAPARVSPGVAHAGTGAASNWN